MTAGVVGRSTEGAAGGCVGMGWPACDLGPLSHKHSRPTIDRRVDAERRQIVVVQPSTTSPSRLGRAAAVQKSGKGAVNQERTKHIAWLCRLSDTWTWEDRLDVTQRRIVAEDAIAISTANQGRQVVSVQLAHGVGAVDLDGAAADAERTADANIGQALGG